MIDKKEQLGYVAQRAWRRFVVTLAVMVAAVIFAGYNPIVTGPALIIIATALLLLLSASPVRKTIAYLKA